MVHLLRKVNMARLLQVNMAHHPHKANMAHHHHKGSMVLRLLASMELPRPRDNMEPHHLDSMAHHHRAAVTAAHLRKHL
jgi:hypothetical protein